MIEVRLVLNPGPDEAVLGIIQIEHDDVTDFGSDYSVRFAVERCGAVGLHQRSVIGFQRTKYNVLGLLLAALNTLDPQELELEQEIGPSDLARRLRRTLTEVQGWARRLHRD